MLLLDGPHTPFPSRDRQESTDSGSPVTRLCSDEEDEDSRVRMLAASKTPYSSPKLGMSSRKSIGTAQDSDDSDDEVRRVAMCINCMGLQYIVRASLRCGSSPRAIGKVETWDGRLVLANQSPANFNPAPPSLSQALQELTLHPRLLRDSQQTRSTNRSIEGCI